MTKHAAARGMVVLDNGAVVTLVAWRPSRKRGGARKNVARVQGPSGVYTVSTARVADVIRGE